jgi:transposase
MARKRTKVGAGPEVLADLKQRLRAAPDLRDKERLRVALWATSGEHTLGQLAQLAGRARSTVQIWLDHFVAGGVEKLLQREAPPGLASPLAQAKVQEQFQAGLKAGRWRTAAQVAAWLEEAHGIKRAAKSIYRWLGKAGGALRVPRPCHVQQDPPATAAFRAELAQRLEKLALPKDKPVKIWVADESRFGLHTQSRRCWALPLPPYSPELNPVEGLWDQVQDCTCNRRHSNLDELEATLTKALQPFWETPSKVLSLIHHWLHDQANITRQSFCDGSSVPHHPHMTVGKHNEITHAGDARILDGHFAVIGAWQ